MEEKYADYIYIKGMVVMEGPFMGSQYGESYRKRIFGYNCLELYLKSRERLNSISGNDVRQEVLNALYDNIVQPQLLRDEVVEREKWGVVDYNYTKESGKSGIDQRKQKERNLLLGYLFDRIKKDTSCEELSILETGRDGKADAIKKAMWENFIRTHTDKKVGTSNVSILPEPYVDGNESQRKKIERLGRIPIPLPYRLYDLFEPYLMDLDLEIERSSVEGLFNCKEIKIDEVSDSKNHAAVAKRVMTEVLPDWLCGLREFREWRSACGSKNKTLSLDIKLVAGKNNDPAFLERCCAISAVPIHIFSLNGFTSNTHLNGIYVMDNAKRLFGYPVYYLYWNGKPAYFLHKVQDRGWGISPAYQFKGIAAGRKDVLAAILESKGNFWDGSEEQLQVDITDASRNSFSITVSDHHIATRQASNTVYGNSNVAMGPGHSDQIWQELKSGNSPVRVSISVRPIVTPKHLEQLSQKQEIEDCYKCLIALNLNSKAFRCSNQIEKANQRYGKFIKDSSCKSTEVLDILLKFSDGVHETIVNTLRLKSSWRVDADYAEVLKDRLRNKIYEELGITLNNKVEVRVLESSEEIEDGSNAIDAKISDDSTSIEKKDVVGSDELDTGENSPAGASTEAASELEGATDDINILKAGEENSPENINRMLKEIDEESETESEKSENEEDADDATKSDEEKDKKSDFNAESESDMENDDEEEKDGAPINETKGMGKGTANQQKEDRSGNSNGAGNSQNSIGGSGGNCGAESSGKTNKNLDTGDSNQVSSSQDQHGAAGNSNHDENQCPHNQESNDYGANQFPQQGNFTNKSAANNSTKPSVPKDLDKQISDDNNSKYSKMSQKNSSTTEPPPSKHRQNNTENFNSNTFSPKFVSEEFTNSMVSAASRILQENHKRIYSQPFPITKDRIKSIKKDCKIIMRDVEELVSKKLHHIYSSINLDGINRLYALRGDSALDDYLVKIAVERSLQEHDKPFLEVKYVDRIRRKLFSCDNLGNGDRSVSEKVEEEIGKMLHGNSGDTDAHIEQVMSSVRIPDPDNTRRETLSVSILVREKVEEMMAGQRKAEFEIEEVERLKREKLEEEERAKKEKLDEEERLKREKLEEEERIKREKLEVEERAKKEKLEREERLKKEKIEEEERLKKEKLEEEERLKREKLEAEEELRQEKIKIIEDKQKLSKDSERVDGELKKAFENYLGQEKLNHINHAFVNRGLEPIKFDVETWTAQYFQISLTIIESDPQASDLIKSRVSELGQGLSKFELEQGANAAKLTRIRPDRNTKLESRRWAENERDLIMREKNELSALFDNIVRVTKKYNELKTDLIQVLLQLTAEKSLLSITNYFNKLLAKEKESEIEEKLRLEKRALAKEKSEEEDAAAEAKEKGEAKKKADKEAKEAAAAKEKEAQSNSSLPTTSSFNKVERKQDQTNSTNQPGSSGSLDAANSNTSFKSPWAPKNSNVNMQEPKTKSVKSKKAKARIKAQNTESKTSNRKSKVDDDFLAMQEQAARNDASSKRTLNRELTFAAVEGLVHVRIGDDAANDAGKARDQVTQAKKDFLAKSLAKRREANANVFAVAQGKDSYMLALSKIPLGIGRREMAELESTVQDSALREHESYINAMKLEDFLELATEIKLLFEYMCQRHKGYSRELSSFDFGHCTGDELLTSDIKARYEISLKPCNAESLSLPYVAMVNRVMISFFEYYYLDSQFYQENSKGMCSREFRMLTREVIQVLICSYSAFLTGDLRNSELVLQMPQYMQDWLGKLEKEWAVST